MTAAPLVPGSRALRLVLTAAVASRSVLAAVLAWFAVVAAVYASDAGPPLPAMAVTAAALLPIGAWAVAASLTALGPDPPPHPLKGHRGEPIRCGPFRRR